jgi:ABC-type multidrug transport system fused ATPase/permease subunit
MWDQVKQALNQSTTKFLTELAHLLPGMVALIVALLISFVLAWILAIVVRRLLAGMHFDERLNRWGFASLGEWSPMNSPARLVSRTAACLVIFSGFLIGIAAFDAESTSLLVRSVFAYVPNIVGAMLVLLVGSIVASFLARSVLIGAVNLNLHYARLVSLGVKWLVLVLAVAMALEHLKIAPGIVDLAFGILFGGIVLTLVLAVGLNSKEIVTKSLERDGKDVSSENVEEPFRHV